MSSNGNNNYASGGSNPPNLYINTADATPGQISGVSPANATIDVYIQSTCESCSSNPATNYAQGRLWVGSTTANNLGNWTYTLSGAATKSNTVVTATDASNNTSEFSACYANVVCTTPSASFGIATSNTLCSTNTTATLSISGAQVSVIYVPVLNGTTITGSTVTASGTSFNISVPGLSVGANSLRVAAYNNCAQTVSGLVTVTVNSAPTFGGGVAGSTICPPSQTSGTLTFTAQPGVRYTAVLGTGTIVGGPGTTSPLTISTTNLSLGSNTVFLLGSIGGCSVATSSGATVFLNPVVNTNGATFRGNTVCLGSNGTVTINGWQNLVTYYPVIGTTTLAGVTTTSINIPSGNLSLGANVVRFLASTAGCGFQSFANTTTVFVNTNPTPSISSAANCGATSTLTLTISSATVGNTYAAYTQGGSLLGSGVANANPYILSISTANLSLGSNTVSVAGFVPGCAVATVSGSVFLNPDVNLNGTTFTGNTVCAGSNGTVTINGWQSLVTYYPVIGTTTLPGVTTTSINIPSGNLSLGANVVRFLASTAGCGFQSFANTATVTSNSNAAPSGISSSPNCAATNTLTLTISGATVGNTYAAYTQGGALLGTGVANTNPYILSISTTNLSFGLNTVSVTGSVAGCGVSNFGTLDVRFNPDPLSGNPSLATGGVVCNGSTATVTATGLVAGVAYYTSVNGTPGAAQVAATGTLVLNTPTLSGTTLVSLFGSVAGCVPVQLATATVVGLPIPDISLSVSGGAVCGTSTGVAVRVGGASQLGVTYQAYYNGSAVGTAQAGDGGVLSLSIPAGTLPVGTNVVSVSGVGCQSATLTDTAVVVVYGSTLTTDFTLSTLTYCGGSTVTVSATTGAGITTYTWVVPVGSTVTGGQGTSVAVVQLGTVSGTVSVTPQGSCGSGNPYSQNVVVVNAPDMSTAAVSGPSSLCAGGVGSFTVTGATGPYIWTYPTGSTVTGLSEVSITAGSTGGTVTVQAYNSCGTGTGVGATYSVDPVPTAVVATVSGSTQFCQNSTVTTVSAVGGTGATAYAWTVAGDASVITGGTTANPTVLFGTTPGTVVFTVTASNACGSSTSAGLSVEVQPNPVLGSGITPPTGTLCAGGTGYVYSISTTAGALGYTWSADKGTVSSGQGTNSVTVDVNAGASGPLTVEVSVSFACATLTTSSQLSINTLPDISGLVLSGPAATCVGAVVSYSIASGGGATDYIWSSTSGSLSSTGGGTATLTVAGSGTVSVLPVGSCGTGTGKSIDITAGDKPGNVSVSLPGTICYYPGGGAGNASTLTVSAQPNGYPVSYQWTVAPPATVTSGQGTSSVGVLFGKTFAAVTVTASNLCGNTVGTNTGAIEVDTFALLAAPTVTGQLLVCGGTTKSFGVTTVAGATSYLWYFPGTLTATSALVPNTLTSPIIGNPVSFDLGQSWATLTVSAYSSRCNQSLTSTAVLTVVGAVDVTGGTSACVGDTKEFSVSTVAGATGYVWTSSNTLAGLSASTLGGTVATYTFSGSALGYTAVVKSVPQAGLESCQLMADSVVVRANIPLGSGVGIVGPDSVCAGQEVSYTVSVSGAQSTSWALPAGSTVLASNTDSSFILLRYGTVGGNVVATSSGCGAPVVATLPGTVLAAPVAHAGGKAVSGDPVRQYQQVGTSVVNLEGGQSSQGSAYTYAWTSVPSFPVTNAGTPSASIDPDAFETKVYLRVGYRTRNTVQPSCSAVDSALVVRDIDQIPAAFSPNGDPVNNTWQIDNLYLYKNARVQVFNKWGAVVYDRTGYPKEKERMWDGTSNGVEVPVAVYYYIIDFGGERGRKPRTGSVTVVR